MSRVAYFVRMVAKEGMAEEVQELLLTNLIRIREGEHGNLAFAVHRSTDNPNEFWLYETWECEEAVEVDARFTTIRKLAQALDVDHRELTKKEG